MVRDYLEVYEQMLGEEAASAALHGGDSTLARCRERIG
jgi:hypothetical protein